MAGTKARIKSGRRRRKITSEDKFFEAQGVWVSERTEKVKEVL